MNQKPVNSQSWVSHESVTIDFWGCDYGTPVDQEEVDFFQQNFTVTIRWVNWTCLNTFWGQARHLKFWQILGWTPYWWCGAFHAFQWHQFKWKRNGVKGKGKCTSEICAEDEKAHKDIANGFHQGCNTQVCSISKIILLDCAWVVLEEPYIQQVHFDIIDGEYGYPDDKSNQES